MAATVDTSGEMADLMTCQFCSKLMNLFHRISQLPSQPHIAHAYGKLGRLSDIMEMPCLHAESIRRLWERGLALHGRIDEDFEEVSPRVWTVNYAISQNLILTFFLDEKFKFELKISLVARFDKPRHPGTTKVLDPRWTEASIPRAWYTKCLREHRHSCFQPTWMRLRPEPIAMPEWLVDVVDNCVVPCNSDTTRYTTLSYTWGGVQCLKHTSTTLERLKKEGSLHPDSAPDIPRTVRDAFEITRLLGERYLWVDSLCISQDETATSKGLNSMHHIYANSRICLIALAGTDANHGLRGIQGFSAPRHIEQLIFDMADGERFSWVEEPHRQLNDDDMLFYHKPSSFEGSSYNERGWTFQENIFAKRRLVFTDGLLRWTCECAAWVEESFRDLSVIYASPASGVSTWWMMNPGPNLEIIQLAAQGFNSRYFTYDADTLRAFLGIQNHIGRDFLGGLNYGHPEMFFDISLLWQEGSKGNFNYKRRLGGAANSDPPSWSWMGWQGEFYFDIDQEFLPTDSSRPDIGFTKSIAQWYAMHSPLASVSDMRPVKCRWQNCRTAVENGSIHIPIGWEKVAINRERAGHYYRTEPDHQGINEHLRSLPSHLRWGIDKFRYPVPLPRSTVVAKPTKQRPFIFAKTSRSFFVAKELVHSSFRLPWGGHGREHPLGLFCRDGERAGLLQLHRALDAPCSPVELVAVVKGWTTAFSEYSLNLRGRKVPGGWGRLSCYFVLCVKWENGVAKRQGTGMVEADVWERNQEPVDLIMG